jgi:NAD-dependent SIR2 family protein deacetylase
MKQILKYGKYNIVTCGKCNCEFAFETTDVIIKEDDTKVVTCPCCKEEINAPVKE